MTLDFAGKSYNTTSLLLAKKVTSNAGDDLHITSNQNGDIFVNGVQIEIPNIPATNGIIHMMKKTIPATTNKVVQDTTNSMASTLSPLHPVKNTTKTPFNNTNLTRMVTHSVPMLTRATNHSNINKHQSFHKPRKHSSSGVKIAIVVVILLMIVIAVGISYIRRNRRMFSFEPLTVVSTHCL